jgi:ketosteroid isomerase-like protein
MSPSLELELRKTNQIFEAAVAARNVETLDSVYTAEARILPPGSEMIAGRENIKLFWKAAIDAMNVAAVRLETLHFELMGDTGYEIGRATLEFAAAAAPPATVKYVVIWKQEDGAWKWHVDIWNPNAGHETEPRP